ncbi:SHOCT domain-containing protein [Haloarcula sp. CBA1127]|uniref:SHOCT domain-containing protein n=1 Tax=Haloarcula sp. CBA1127 TaxID=1765055 RepID=UPI00073E1548|nr:SHOCT domain-containing protein [Haloarcula sp. CBA1127]
MPSTTDRAQSTPVKVLLYGLLGLVSLFVVFAAVRVAFGLFFGLIGIILGLLSLAATIGFIVAIGYAVYWVVSEVFGQDEATASTTGASRAQAAHTTGEANETDPVDRLSERYANGEITEAELERRLEQALDGPSVDDSGTAEFERDRELN